MKQPEKGSGNLFTHPRLEALTRTSPWVIFPMDLLLAFGMAFYAWQLLGAELLNYVWLFFLGLFVWTFIEYSLHRFAFHRRPRSEADKKRLYIMHGIHHHYPHDADRLLMPPFVNLAIAASLTGFFALFMGKLVFLFMPGVILGYLTYAFIHYSIHRYKPFFPWLKPLWRNHNLHHFRYPNMGFGVSTLLWDKVFGTLPPKHLGGDQKG